MLVNDLTDAHFSDLLDVHGSQNLQQFAYVVNPLKTGLNAEVSKVRKKNKISLAENITEQ